MVDLCGGGASAGGVPPNGNEAVPSSGQNIYREKRNE